MSLDQEHRTLATIPTLVADFVALGIRPGMVLIVHSSLKSLSAEVNGGAVAVVLALEQVLGTEGTLVMPTHSPQLSNPANWVAPPVPEAWWKTMRETMPAFDQALTPTFRMGIIPETFRKQSGVLRSNHPDASFAAWGKYARPDHRKPRTIAAVWRRLAACSHLQLGWMGTVARRRPQSKHFAPPCGVARANSAPADALWSADDG